MRVNFGTSPYYPQPAQANKQPAANAAASVPAAQADEVKFGFEPISMAACACCCAAPLALPVLGGLGLKKLFSRGGDDE